MDTGSHLLFGVTLAGASLAIPAVAAEPSLLHAIAVATVLGSHAPDFDTVARLRGQTTYLRVHRGITHSLPAPLVWAIAIGWPSAILFGQMAHVGLIVLWTLLAVLFHIGLDLFNGYGVQCLRPFSRRWLHLDSLCLFDPYLFAGHAAAALLWLTGAVPAAGMMFIAVYALTLLYIGWRLVERFRKQRQLQKHFGEGKKISLLPHLSGRSWQFVANGPEAYETGTVDSRGIHVDETIAKASCSSGTEPAMAAMGTDGVRTFLSFATNVHVQVLEKLDGYVVTWRDVRFSYKHKMPYSAAVTLDRQLNVQSSTLGWDKKTWEPPYV